MELFAAGDESQMAVIRRWIDESDVFLLILGGRYGSIEPESGKSYIHLEYEYALEQGKPLFAVVITPEHLEAKVQKHGTAVVEMKEPQKLEDFREFVKTKLVKFWDDPRDITVAIYKTLAEFLATREMTGWVPGSEPVNIKALVDEIAQLRRENTSLQEQVKRASPVPATFNQFTFDDMYNLLLDISIGDDVLDDDYRWKLKVIADAFGDQSEGLIHLFWMLRDLLQIGMDIDIRTGAYSYLMKLEAYGFVNILQRIGGQARFALNENGKQFLLKLRMERDVKKVDEHVIVPQGNLMHVFPRRQN
jgi:hypothetical protein